MKAAIRTGWTGLTYTFSTDYPVPKLTKPNQVLIKTEAAAINPVDYKAPKAFLGTVYGIDMCGKVTVVGKDVTAFKVGDLVFGPCKGSLAEYTIADVDKIAKVPAGWTVTDAAALPVAYDTAVTGWKKLGITAESPVESMLVIGASGGCGIAGLQLAKGMGVKRIVAVCSLKNTDFVKENGATEVVDYNDKEGVEKFLKDNVGKLDHVYDTASGSGGNEDYATSTLPLLTETGTYVALNGKAVNMLGHLILGSGFRDKRQHLHLATHSTADLETVTSLLDKAKLKPIVSLLEFSEEGVKDGFAQLKGRRTKGKLVFKIAEEE